MNFKTIASAALFAVASSATIAAQASSVSMESSSSMHYRYGDRLDVKKVLSVEDDRSNACGSSTRASSISIRTASARALNTAAMPPVAAMKAEASGLQPRQPVARHFNPCWRNAPASCWRLRLCR